MRSIIISIIILCCAQTFSAQRIVEVVNIEKDDGLHDRIVDRIIRDDQGYFIIFQKNTIQKYDGNQFINIDISAFKNANLEVRDINNVFKLNDGTIIMSLDHQRILFHLESGQKSISTTQTDGLPKVINGELYSLKPVNSNSTNPQFHLYKGVLGETKSAILISEVPLPNNIQSLAIIDNSFYAQTADNSVFYFDNKSIHKLNVGGKLIQRANGIYIFDYGSIHKVTGKSVSKVQNLLDRSYSCDILKADGQGNIIAAYNGQERFQDRLYVLDINDSLHVMQNIIEENDVFKDFHTDDAFYRWMLGGYNGMHVISLLREGTEIIDQRPGIKKGQFGRVVTGLASNGDEMIYFGEAQGVYKHDRIANEPYEVLTTYLEKGDYVQNSKMYFHEESNAYYSHAYRYDGKSNVYKFNVKNNTSENHILPLKLNDIFVRNPNDIIVGGWNEKTGSGILAAYNLRNKEYKILKENIPIVRSIYFDEESKIYWIGTHNGLLVLDESFNLIDRLSKKEEKHKRLSSDHIGICNRYNDKIIAGSYGGGIYVIDPLTYKVEAQISEENGLTDDNAIGIIPDDIGNCWITTFNGVNIIDESFKITRKIYEHEGLPNREFNSKAIAKDTNGAIYAGSLNGVSILEPSKIMSWKKSSGIDVSEILGFDGKSIDKLEFNNPVMITKAYDSLKVSYDLPDYNTYPYVSEIVDISVIGKTLDAFQGDNSIILKNIKLGSSSVSIQPRYGDLSQSINITRKLDYQLFFKVLLCFLLMCLAVWYFVNRFISINNAREAEKTRLNKKISELQLSSLQSQMNPHFIFNALGAVQYFIQTHETDRADEYLSDFAMLMRSILESSKSKFIRLSEELRLLKLYVGLECVRFDDLFDYNIKVDVNVDTEINLPPMIIQPFVENAINHGLFNLKNKKGQLTIHFAMPIEDKLIVTITDNGIGRTQAARVRMKKHKPRGMQLVQERLDTLKNSKSIKIETETFDLMEGDTPAGTKVVITIES